MKRIQGTDKHIIAHVIGDDIVVRNVLITAFGYNDPADNGETESGMKNGPDVMGCALPVRANEKATHDSPLAFGVPIPWHTLVEFWDERDPGRRVTVQLIDNGPDVKHYPDHGGDLCVAPAGVFRPDIPIEKRSVRFEETLSYRIIGGAKYVPQSLLIEDGEDDDSNPPGNVHKLCTAFLGALTRFWRDNTGKEVQNAG